MPPPALLNYLLFFGYSGYSGYSGYNGYSGYKMSTPIRRLTDQQLRRLLYGSGSERIECHFKHNSAAWEHRSARIWKGIIPLEMARFRKIQARPLREKLEALMRRTPCPDCGGGRLRPESLAVTVKEHSIAAVCAMSIGQTHQFFEALSKAVPQSMWRQLLQNCLDSHRSSSRLRVSVRSPVSSR